MRVQHPERGRQILQGGADEDGVRTVPEPRFALLAVISSFVLAELGDKTMLATVALASDHDWAGVWIGATAGMVLADGVAIAVGRVLHRRLPERFLHVLASVLFLLFGLCTGLAVGRCDSDGGRGGRRPGNAAVRGQRRLAVAAEPLPRRSESAA